MRGLFIITSVLLVFLLSNARENFAQQGAANQPAKRHFHIIASSNEETVELIVPETRIALEVDRRALSAETLKNLVGSGSSTHRDRAPL